MAFVTLATILLMLAVLTSATSVYLMAHALLSPPRMTDGKAMWFLKRLSPADLKLLSADVEFKVRDDRTGRPMKIAGWWIPAAVPSDKTVVFLHGYADAKVGAIGWAPLWHSLGFNVLAIDLRAHGESEGDACTGGCFERHDVSSVINQLRAGRPAQTRQVVLFGASMGGAIAIAIAAEREDLAAIVIDSPYADFGRAAMSQMDRVGAPGRRFQRMAIRLAERIAGIRFAEVQPVALIPKSNAPIFLIQSGDEPGMSADDIESLRVAWMDHFARHPEDRYWVAAGAPHLLALATHPAEYRAELTAFLSGACSAEPLAGNLLN